MARDFLVYCQCWSESMHHHHDAEEQTFFPEVEKITQVNGIMEQNVEQHRAFTPGFDKFYEYCKTCPSKSYDGEKLRGLVEAFADPLTQHLYDEVETLRALDKYDSDSGKIRQAYQRFEKSLMAIDNVKRFLIRACFWLLTCHSIELRLWSSVLQTGVLRAVYTTSRLCRFLCLMSLTTYLACGTVGYGVSIQARAGEIAEN